VYNLFWLEKVGFSLDKKLKLWYTITGDMSEKARVELNSFF
jgi:hypothetical protein